MYAMLPPTEVVRHVPELGSSLAGHIVTALSVLHGHLLRAAVPPILLPTTAPARAFLHTLFIDDSCWTFRIPSPMQSHDNRS